MEREKNFQRFLLLAMAVLAIIFYEGKLCWELIILAAYTGALYGFFCVALRKAGEADRASLRYGICFFAIFAVPVYAAASYFATPQVSFFCWLCSQRRRGGTACLAARRWLWRF